MDNMMSNEEKSTQWFMMAINLGDTKSMMAIAKEYKKGWFFKKDLHKALHFYQMAYDNGEFELSSKIDKLEQKIKKLQEKKSL
jgi:TPR repeat protein